MTKMLRALIVEDSANDAELLVHELHRAGFEVIHERVETQPAMEAALRNRPWDVVLSDFSLPSFGGKAALQLLRDEALEIPFIFVSATIGEEAAVEAVNSGAYDYVLKNNLQRLAPAVERALAEAKRRRELQRTENALRQSEYKYRSLFEGMNDAALLVAADSGRIIDANHQAELLVGWSRGELIGMNHSRLYVAETAADNCRRFIEPAQSGLPDYEADVLHRNGQRIPVVVSVSLLELQGRDLRLGIFRDITERKRAQERLAIQHEVTRVLAESAFGREAFEKLLAVICERLGWAAAEIWTLDPTNNVLCCGGLGHKPGPELAGFKEAIQQMTFARGADLPGRAWESGQPEWVTDIKQSPGFTRSAAAGRAGLCSVVSIPIKSKGAVIGVLEVLDTQTRAPDAQQLQFFETLCAQVGQFMERKQIEEQLRQSQKMEAVGQLAGGVAHDFNNLLSVIAGHAHVLLMDAGLGADLVESAKQISTAALRAAELTRQLLAFSRKQVLDVCPVNLNDTITNVTRMLQRVIGEDIRLEQQLTRELPVIRADEGMLEQVLLNLVVNARDAMPGGGRLVIRTDAVKLDQDYARQSPEASAGDFVRLTVADTGCGIPPEVLPHIFEPFFTTKEVGKGTGLGLATVYGIARQHNGWVEVKTRAGAGTDFKVFLPVSPQPGAQRVREEQPPVQGGNETIFLVEDDAAVRGTARHILRRYGYKVIEATSGAEALTRWGELQGKVDLVLTDIVMPDGVTGRELAERLRAQQPDLKVIFTSGYTMNLGNSGADLREGVNFLQKPYAIRALAKVVRDCLDRKT